MTGTPVEPAITPSAPIAPASVESLAGQDSSRIPTRLQLDTVRGAAIECLRTALIAKHLLIPWAVPRGNLDKKFSDLKRLQTELTDAIQRFNHAWTADVADWFYLHRPNRDARFGEYLTAAQQVRDCCDKALFAAGTAIEVRSGGFGRGPTYPAAGLARSDGSDPPR